MNKKFIGYLLKTNNYSFLSEFENLGSVSNCIRNEPNKKEDIWNYNDCGFFDTIEKAKLNTPEKQYTLFAYFIYNFSFSDGEKIHSSKLLKKVGKIKTGSFDKSKFVFIGFDIVGNDLTDGIECSPLSCNYAFRDFKTNRFCLIDHYDDAVEICRTFSKGEYEPGDYYIFEVWRENLLVKNDF